MKHLLKHFKDLSIHPKNAAELKGLILQLAIQGKLTANWRLENPDVEPASVLLERIKEEKKQLVKDKKIRKEKTLPEITKEEMPFELPDSWSFAYGQNLFSFEQGIQVDKNKQILAPNAGYQRFLRIVDFTQETDDIRYVPILNEKYLVTEDSIVMVRYGTVGFVGSNKKGILANNLFKINYVELIKEYILSFYQSSYFQKVLKEYTKGGAMPSISFEFMKKLLVSVPPLEEQKAIVSIVNTLFAEVEQLEALTKERIQLKEAFVTSALQQLTNSQTINGEWAFLQQHFPTFFTELPNIKKLRESILQLAVQGKLTTHWRKYNPDTEDASVLLERIKAEKDRLVKEKKIKKEKPLPEIPTDEIPYELPEGWVWTFSNNLFRYEQGIQVDKNLQKTKSVSGYIRFLRIVDYTQNTDDIRYVEHPGDKYIVSKYSLVMVRYGASAGFIGSELEGVLANNLFKIHYGSLNKGFIKLMFQSPYFMSELKLNTKGGAMPAINFGFLNSFKFPLPPLSEQKAIVEKVNALMALCDQLEQEIQNSKTKQEDWMKSSLREVFAPEAETKE